MKSLTVDSKTGKAVSQTGNLLGDLAQGLWDNGKRALPHGTCPYVGTGGHASYGGFGLFSREAGLLLDRITAAEVVIANGTVLTVSNTTHPDLFWALRGAAPSFGIVTAWTFATLAAPKTLINYTLAWSKKISRSQAIQILNAYQTFAASKPRNELSMLCPLGVDDGAIDLTFTGTYYGSLTDFKAAIKPFQSKLPGSPKLTTKTFNWYDGLVDVTGPLSTKKPEPYDTFFAKSVVISKPLASSAVENWVDYMLQKGGDTGLWWWVEIDMYGGAVAQVPENTTAYAHRNNILNFQFYGGTPNGKGKFPSSGISFINGLASSLAPKPSGAYPNYIDPTLTADQWHTLYFAGNYGRLTKIKKAWDPRNVFSFPQSIPLAK
ncbi:hypothetical protein FRB99_007965 [Tulasnella sp. 403]|nr:hypothetical protein FRB99_007965 [Tulasnella sp. 403]